MVTFAKLRNQEIVGGKKENKTTNHKLPLPLKMGYDIWDTIYDIWYTIYDI